MLSGQNTYTGGTIAQAGTLIAAYQTSLPGTTTGCGTIIVQPTLYWFGQGDCGSGTWRLGDGTLTSFINGASIFITAGSDLTISNTVSVSAITVRGNATIEGCGTINLPASGSTINVLAETAIFQVAFAGGTPIKTGLGTADFLAPLASPPVVDGGQAIGPGAVFSDNESLAALDPAMFNLVQSLFVDQTIDRADMIQILDSAAIDRAVTPTALAALEMITTSQNEAVLATPNYVAVLASDVVQGNAANAIYQGQPLGNLAAQPDDATRATALTDLVDKWFYGDDLPAVPAGLTYITVAGPLYGNNPDPAMQIPSSIDDEQGCIGDCYLISALGAIADSNPAAIENMIIPNGVENGIASYTVRFYYQNATTGVYVPDYVTVNAFMPTFSDGCVVFANPGPNGSWWMPIVEKAYAQWNETGHEGRDGTNTYVALADGWMDIVDEQVLGTAATDYFPKASDLTTEAALVSAIQGGEAVTAAIFLGNGDPNAFTQLQLVSGHAYEIAGYDAASQTFQLENPWGCYEPAPLTWSQFSTYCAWAAVANTSSTITASSVSAGATTATSAATDVEAHATELGAVRNRQSVNDAALLAYLDGNQNLHAQDTTTDAYARALERVLAELGRDVK